MPFARQSIESYTHTHTHTVKINQVSTYVSLHMPSPVHGGVTYHPATSATRHLLSGAIWRPFNPPSKEVFPVNEGKRDPNTKRGGGQEGCEGLAEW